MASNTTFPIALIPAKYTEVLANIVDVYNINLFDFPYELPEGTGYTPETLQQKFIDHFYFREIGQETIDMFKKYLQVKWTEVIGYYGKLFALSDSVDPQDLTNDDFSNSGLNVFNNAPKGVVEFDKKHATNYTKYNSTAKGRRGLTQAEAARRNRDSVFDPIFSFLDEFEDLFMQIY